METDTITIDRENYITIKAFYEDFGKLLEILTRNKKQCLIRYEDCGVYSISIAVDQYKTDYGADRFMLVTEDEEEAILNTRICNKDLEDK